MQFLRKEELEGVYLDYRTMRLLPSLPKTAILVYFLLRENQDGLSRPAIIKIVGKSVRAADEAICSLKQNQLIEKKERLFFAI